MGATQNPTGGLWCHSRTGSDASLKLSINDVDSGIESGLSRFRFTARVVGLRSSGLSLKVFMTRLDRALNNIL